MRKLTLFIVFIFITHNSFSQIGIGTLNPNTSAKLDITSGSKGFLLPKMTLLQRNAITNPTAGLQVWCTDCATNGILQIFNGNLWVNSAGTIVTALTVPSAPTNAVATVLGYTSASVSFSPPLNNGGSGISSYTVTASPGGFSFTGSALNYVFTGLLSGTSYTFSVLASNSAGTSSAAVANAVTTYAIDGNAVCDGTGFFEYLELTSSTGKIWMDRNLGAKRAATSSTDNYAYGCLYQWGRGNDGHASISWSASTAGSPINGTSSTLSSTTTSTNALFITNASTPYDWLSLQNNNLWQYRTDINNPCPTGFRLPTSAEFESEFNSYLISNSSTAFSNGPNGGFKLVTPGTRNATSGTLTNTGGTGSYWTQSTSGISSIGYTIGSNILSAIYSNRSNGLSVRCIKGTLNSESLTLIPYPQDGKVLIQFNAITNATDYEIYYKLNTNNTNWTTYPDGVSTTAGATVEGLTNGVVYNFMVKAIVSGNTPVLSTLLSATPTTIVNNNVYHQILTSGQSLSLGCCGNPITLTQPYSNKKINNQSNVTSLIPLIEPNTSASNETKSSAMANYISYSTFNNVNGDNFRSIVTLSGSGGSAFWQINKGTSVYNYGLSRMSEIKNILQSQNSPYLASAITFVHGETDNNNIASTYKSYLVGLQNDYQTDIRKITGQTDAIPLFLCQLSSVGGAGSTGASYTSVKTPIGQLDAAEENPSKIYLVTPKYMFDYIATHDFHMTAYSFRRLGEYYGKVMKKVLVDGVAWKPLSPSTVSISSNVITVNFNVPVAPLQFDTIKVMSTANYGFEYFDATNSATITNVALASNGTSILITLSNTPTGANKKIAYAYTNSAPIPAPAYGVAGGRYNVYSAKGNLRDSDITPALYTDNLPTNFGTQLNNWCVHFIKDIN